MSLRLIPTKPAKPFPVADRSRDGHLYEPYHPQLAAIRHLREAIANGNAGLDPYDGTIFLLDARPHEQVWARTVVQLVGLPLGIAADAEITVRYRLILEADIRQELDLDDPGAPVLHDEPLASRRIDEAAIAAGLRLLANPQTPVIRAIADARDAQQRASERSS